MQTETQAMLHLLHTPNYPLNQFVEHFWMVDTKGVAMGKNKLLPDGAIELLINLGPPQKLIESGSPDGFRYCRRSWISGERCGALIFESLVTHHILGIRFKPGGAYPFFDFPISELTEQVVEMDLICGPSIADLRDQLLEKPIPQVQFALVETWLRNRAGDRLEPNPVVHFALDRIERQKGDVSIGGITQETGVSHRHLIRLFERTVGLRPKMLARILKLQKALHLIETLKSPHWTQVAYECNYYDQAHFNRDFKIFTGYTPSSYFTKRGPYVNYIPLP